MKKKPDIFSFIGFIGAFVVVLTSATLEGTPIPSLFNIPALFLITAGVTVIILLNFDISQIMLFLKNIANVFFKKEDDPIKYIDILVKLSEKARKEGLVRLEEDLATIEDDFTKSALQLVVDGSDMEMIRAVMEMKLETILKEYEESAEVAFAMGGYAPTVGIIGTVMGLIHVLSLLGGDIHELGHGVGTAFLATFYGVASANLIFLPFSGKLKGRAKKEEHIKSMIMEGILSIQAGENPRILKDKLLSYLSEAEKKKAGASGESEKEG